MRAETELELIGTLAKMTELNSLLLAGLEKASEHIKALEARIEALERSTFVGL